MLLLMRMMLFFDFSWNYMFNNWLFMCSSWLVTWLKCKVDVKSSNFVSDIELYDDFQDQTSLIDDVMSILSDWKR